MTDAEITRLAAEKVMGWTVRNSRGGEYYDDPSSDVNHPWVRDWHSLTDWRAAGEIVDRMRADGWQMDATVLRANCVVLFTKEIDGEMECGECVHPVFPRAISISALLAVGAITEEQLAESAAPGGEK